MSAGDRSGEDQSALFGDEGRREHLRAAAEAGERWDRRIAHISVCTVTPWWDSPPDCNCQENSR